VSLAEIARSCSRSQWLRRSIRVGKESQIRRAIGRELVNTSILGHDHVCRTESINTAHRNPLVEAVPGFLGSQPAGISDILSVGRAVESTARPPVQVEACLVRSRLRPRLAEGRDRTTAPGPKDYRTVRIPRAWPRGSGQAKQAVIGACHGRGSILTGIRGSTAGVDPS
jgi:hypothetical protein